ncbi:hypothetical protein Y032_0118g715 [Ancylostoma ceylanicum]|nr:hypothetical protein Y032_0118g715 [Ancylostoma ceylanicum]
MRLLVLLALLECVVGAPRQTRQAPIELANIPQALNTAPEHFAKHALFIPRGQEPDGFDPSKPIQGAFFISGDAQQFNLPPHFRLPQRQLPVSRPAVVPLPAAEAAPAPIAAVDETTPTAPTPTAPHVIPEAPPEEHAVDTTAVLPALPAPIAPAVEELVTTTQVSAPTLPVVVEQSTAPPAAPQPLPIDPNLPPVDKSVDLDGDGRLSLSEVQYAAFVHHGLSSTVVQGMFNEVDHNKDGYLDSAEFNDIRGLVLAKAENAALRYMQSVDTDKNKMLSLEEAQAYILKEHGIGSRDVERVWKLVVPDTTAEMDALQFSKLRRRIRGMTIRLARQIMKIADTNGDGHISLDEAQAIAFEQEGIGAGDVAQMFASVDDNNDGELNAPEFADFERIVRARAVETSKKALRVVDTDGSNTLTMDEAKRIAFEHYGFDENILTPFFDQADENEDGHLDAVEFAGFRSVIRSKAVRNAVEVLKEIDLDGDGLVSMPEAEEKTKREDDMESHETATLFNIADQNKSGKLDKVELADFIRLVRLSAIRFATDHFKEFDANRDRLVTVDELAQLIETKYHVPFDVTKEFFSKVDVDGSGDLIPAEIVDFRHEIRKYVAQHPMPFPSEREDKQSAESVEVTVTTVTTTVAPTTTTTHSTTASTTRRRSTRARPTTTQAPPTSAEQSTQTTSFPTLLPSTRRKVTFRKHTTASPQTNGIEEFLPEPAGFEGRSHPDSSFDSEDDVDKPLTRAPKVWKPHRPTTTHSTSPSTTLTPAPSTVTHTTRRRPSPRTTTTKPSTEPDVDANTWPTSSERPRSTRRRWTTATKLTTEEPTTTLAISTAKPRRRTTTTTERTTTTGESTTTTTTTEPPPTTTRLTTTARATTTTTPDDLTTSPGEEFEYEIVEVEVDENGNEIVGENSAEKPTVTNVPQISRQKDIGDADRQSNEEEQRESEQRIRKRPEAIETSLEAKVEEEQRQQRRPDAEKQSADTVREQEERKKLVEAQKRALNLPADAEVEYVDGDTTMKPDENEAEEGEYVEKEAER